MHASKLLNKYSSSKAEMFHSTVRFVLGMKAKFAHYASKAHFLIFPPRIALIVLEDEIHLVESINITCLKHQKIKKFNVTRSL